jgi:glycyl-radical enzyme activating protein
MSKVIGKVFEIQRFSIHDGPGIRTTVFFQGCPLHCAWCHNPEGITDHPMLSFIPARCIGCGRCLVLCQRGAHKLVDGQHVLDRKICQTCGACTRECWAGALEMSGKEMSVEEVMKVVLRDHHFYETSDGGLTISGGEPLKQARFAKALLSAAKTAGLHCCVETSGFVLQKTLLSVQPLVDLFLYDIKEIDEAKHREFTGVSNKRILANLRALYATGALIRLRLPVVPGYNDSSEYFAGVAQLAAEMPRLEGVEVLPYHRLGESKLERFGIDPATRAEAIPPDPEVAEGWRKSLEAQGVKVIRQ